MFHVSERFFATDSPLCLFDEGVFLLLPDREFGGEAAMPLAIG
jgi:hypothetical protein